MAGDVPSPPRRNIFAVETTDPETNGRMGALSNRGMSGPRPALLKPVRTTRRFENIHRRNILKPAFLKTPAGHWARSRTTIRARWQCRAGKCFEQMRVREPHPCDREVPRAMFSLFSIGGLRFNPLQQGSAAGAANDAGG